MTKIKLILILLASVTCYVTHAQNITVSGYVSEAGSGERLIGATVFIPGRNIGTTTNAYGFFVAAHQLILCLGRYHEPVPAVIGRQITEELWCKLVVPTAHSCGIAPLQVGTEVSIQQPAAVIGLAGVKFIVAKVAADIQVVFFAQLKVGFTIQVVEIVSPFYRTAHKWLGNKVIVCPAAGNHKRRFTFLYRAFQRQPGGY